jgi:sugar phosphate isomerase/epimerase
MRQLMNFLLIVMGIVSMYACSSSPNKLTPKKLGWKIGIQSYSFRKNTLFQAIDKVQQLGLHYIEVYPGQKVGGRIQGTTKWTNANLDKAARLKIKTYLKEHGVKLISYGVVAPSSKAQWDSLFVFANEMEIKVITASPKKDQLGYVAKLGKKYNIKVAIHDEPRPLPWWNPDSTLAAIQSANSPYVGVCADVGNWVRSNVKPLKAIKKLKGHIMELHMKNEKTWGKPNEDVVWNKGVENMKGIVKSLHQQNFKGNVIVEYETNPKHNMDDITKSLKYFNKIIGELK